MKILLATNNKKKLIELKKILDNEFELLTLDEVGIVSIPEENGELFEDNAKIKAKHAAELAKMWCIADDSGLCVDSLNGNPGVRSARYSGENATDGENIELLLKNMENTDQRNARFICVIALCDPNGECQTVRGECEGQITRKRKGDGGFGYDSVFYSPEYKKTFAELSMETKNKISHRAKALEKLKKLTEKINDK